MPLHDKEAKNIIKALQAWATQFGPSVTFNLHSIKHIHGNYDSSFTSKDFMDACNNAGIKVTFAAPRHQEQNGIFEQTWQSIRYIAMGDLNHARMGMEFFYFALENAWKVFAVLPQKALTTADGRVQCPLGVYRPDQPVKVGRFRVLFCPVLVTIGPRTLTE
jgi:transposase InsO family protein